jgi:uncharacterized protein (TIGR03085 family)
VTSLASAARRDLADLLETAGPSAPTLCGDWTTRDLAAHLVLRERRPDAAAGIVVGALAGHTRSVQDSIAKTPWPGLLSKVRSRPLLLISPVDDLVNTTEFFVHAEDVRRAVEGWQPRPLDPALETAFWRTLRARGRLFFRKANVGVMLELPDGTRHVAKDGSPAITLVGPASELLLYAFGRTGHTTVDVRGDADAVRAFTSTDLSV